MLLKKVGWYHPVTSTLHTCNVYNRHEHIYKTACSILSATTTTLRNELYNYSLSDLVMCSKSRKEPILTLREYDTRVVVVASHVETVFLSIPTDWRISKTPHSDGTPRNQPTLTLTKRTTLLFKRELYQNTRKLLEDFISMGSWLKLPWQLI